MGSQECSAGPPTRRVIGRAEHSPYHRMDDPTSPRSEDAGRHPVTNEDHPRKETSASDYCVMISPPTSSIGDRASESRSISASIVARPQASTSGVGHRNNRGGLEKVTPPITGLRGHRWHAAWRASMTWLFMNQFNQTSGCRRHAASGACETGHIIRSTAHECISNCGE